MQRKEKGAVWEVVPTQFTFSVCFRNLRVMHRAFQWTVQKPQSFPSYHYDFHSFFILSSSFAFLPLSHLVHGAQTGSQNYLHSESKKEISESNQPTLDYGVGKEVTRGKDSTFVWFFT